jgi:hypothetical protein
MPCVGVIERCMALMQSWSQEGAAGDEAPPTDGGAGYPGARAAPSRATSFADSSASGSGGPQGDAALSERVASLEAALSESQAQHAEHLRTASSAVAALHASEDRLSRVTQELTDAEARARTAGEAAAQAAREVEDLKARLAAAETAVAAASAGGGDGGAGVSGVAWGEGKGV